MAILTRRSMRRVLRRLALLGFGWCVLTGHVFSGCNGLFKPATPEPPSGPPIIPNYSSPEATLRTMVAGMQAKGPGALAWQGAFADSANPADGPAYHQVFDAIDYQSYTSSCGCTPPSDWLYGQEEDFFQHFLSNVHPSDAFSARFDLVEELPDPIPGDTQALLYREYQVLATSTDTLTTSIIAIGIADLTFTKFQDRWLITRWVDHRSPRANPKDLEQLTLGRRRLESQ